MPSIHDGHRERVKNRFLTEGLDSFAPHEVLELLLFYAMPYKDTNVIAHKLLDEFGSVLAVMDADVEALMQVPGVGRNSAVLLKLIPELAKVYQKDKWQDRVKLNTTTIAAQFLMDMYQSITEEAFFVLCLDSQNRLIRAEKLSEGTISETSVNPRSMMDVVLKNKAANIILAHNHPGGNPSPSMTDLESTRKIINLFAPVGIMVYDHIIVSGTSYFSFSQHKLLAEKQER